MSECFTCKNKIEIQKHKHVICGRTFEEEEMIQDGCALYPPIQKAYWYCEKCFDENVEYEREQGLRC